MVPCVIGEREGAFDPSVIGRLADLDVAAARRERDWLRVDHRRAARWWGARGGLLGGGVVGWVGTWTITLELTNLTVAAPFAASFTVAVAAFKDVLTRAAAGLTEMEESL